MIKTIINRFIKAALDELFVDSPSVHLSMGSDMFSDSKINLSNLTFRPDLFDVLGQPFVLRAGHLGCLNVEGIAELAIGGQLKFMAEDIFLLFGLDIIPDPERTQSLKKILIEMQNPKFSSIIITDLIKKLVGLSCGPESDIKAKRKTLYKIFDYFTKGFFFTIKNIHIRFEFKLPGAEIGKDCNGIGVTIPLIKIMPTSTQSRPPEIPQQNPVLSFIVKSIQIYVDYGREQYSQDNLGSIVEFFKRQSNSEKHLTLLGLFDLEMVLALDVKRKTGLICPKLFIHIPRVRVSIDKDQLEVIDQAVNAVACVKRRFQQASRVQKIFRSGHPLPRVSEITSIRLLPHLSLRGTSYPRCAIPRAVAVGLVAFMKDRVGSRWPVMLWKHLIRLVLHDLRRVRPFGRWREIIWLTKVRREYAFSYARLLKRVNDSVGFIYNIHSTLPASKMRDLFEFEMILSVDAVLMFRTLAYMVAAVGFFYYKKRTSNQYSPSMGEGSLTWRDILKIFTELFEAKRESAFHRFDRTRHDDEDDNLSVDDASTVKYSDDGTVYSHTTQTRIPIPFEERNTPNKGTPSSKSSLSMHQVTKKLFSGIGFGSVVSDDADVKIFGRLDFSSFGESVSSLLDKDDRIKDALGVGEAPFIITDDLEGIIKGSVSSTNFHLAQIVDAVQWVMVRHQDPLTFLPPDVSLKIDKFAAELKQPSDGSQGDRLILGAMQISDLHVTLNISQSSSVGTERGTPNSSEKIKIPRGFSSLSGALIQLRVVTKQFSISLSVPQATRMEASKRLVSESNLVHLESFQTRTHSNGGVDLNQSISSHGPVSLNNFPDDTNSESEDSCRVGTMNDLKVNLIPGKTVMESISYQRSLLEQEERKKDIQRANSDVAMARKLKSTEINIDTPVFSMKVLRPADSGSFDEVLREIITSNSNDLALVFCLILDLDDKGEGAADLQIQVGGLTADMDSQAMSSLLNPKYCEYFGVLGEVYQDIQQSLKLFDDSVILLDWASKSPLVGCAFDFLSDQEQIVEDMDTLSLNEEKDSHEIGNGSDYESRDNKRNQRKAIIFYRGFIQWLTFLEQKLPRVLSLCFRSGPVLIQSLESSIIRNLVFAKFQSVIDRAVNRGSGHSKSTELEGVFLLLRQLIRKDDSFREKMRRREFRKWGSKTKGMSSKFVYEKNSELEDTQSPNNSHVKILIPAIDFVVAKLTVPYPSLSIEVQGHSIIKLPMSDETICHYLAWFLAEIMPVEK